MKLCLFLLLLFAGNSACREHSTAEYSTAEAQQAMLPPDVIAQTKPLIKGRLYKEASLEDGAVLLFDTSQQIQILDTTNNLFIKARIMRDTTSYTGYVLKAILPE